MLSRLLVKKHRRKITSYGCRESRFGPVWIRFEKYMLSQTTSSTTTQLSVQRGCCQRTALEWLSGIYIRVRFIFTV